MLMKSLSARLVAGVAVLGGALLAAGCNSDTANAASAGTTSGVAVTTDASYRWRCYWQPGKCQTAAPTNSAPTISGAPPTTATVGVAYAFTPSASDANGDALSFSIANKPAWAAFSTATGALTGTPAAGNVGATSGIVIRVSDGKATTSLPAFTITVAAAATTGGSSGGTTTGSGSSSGGGSTTVPLTAACSSALQGSHATYDVGPGKTYAELTDVPWLSLQAGDVVNIYYRATPYRTYVALKAQGTATDPVVINGVTDAGCNRPEINGSGAVYAADRASGYDNQYSTIGSAFYIWWGNGGWARKPKFITIQNLRITGASTGIYAVTVEDFLVQNCEITGNNGWGIFVNTKNDDPNGEETSYRVTIRGNQIYDNGVVGSYLFHNLYIQSYRATYEGNYIGQLVPGAQGSSLKDRSSGTIIRYNTIVAAARALDLVETEGGHGTVDADPLYNEAWVYGNLIINDSSLPGASSGALIHWGYDNTFAEARTGTLHFYDNTLYNNTKGTVAVFDQQSNNDTRDPQNTVEVQNSVLWASSGRLAMGKSLGKVSFSGGNWISSGWLSGTSSTSSGVVVTTGGTLLAGTSPGLDANYRPASGSPVIGAAAGTTPTPVLYEFAAPAGVAARATARDLGAFEH